jgi:hypothetical protein
MPVVGLTGMILTKETYAIHVACAVLAIPTLAFRTALSRVPDAKPAKQTWSWIDLAMIVIAGAFAIVFFYSGNFFNWDGCQRSVSGVQGMDRRLARLAMVMKSVGLLLGLMMPHFEIKRAIFGYELPIAGRAYFVFLLPEV